MKSSAFYAVIGFGILIIAGVVWWGIAHTHSMQGGGTSTPVASAPSITASDTPPLVGLSIYTSGDYGFSIMYPASAKTSSTFGMYYHLPALWRVGAVSQSAATGTSTPILAIIGYQIKNDSTYPRYFDTEVRIGVSTYAKDIATCTRVSNGEIALPDKVINGTMWKVFTFQDAAMMQYVKAISYRVVHENSCYALEQIQTGSNYRDSPNTADISDATLQQKYSDLGAIIQSFRFARP